MTIQFQIPQHKYWLPATPVLLLFCLTALCQLASAAGLQTSSKIDRIQQEIIDKKARIQSSEKQKMNLHKELHRMDNNLKIGQQKLAVLQVRLLQQEGRIKEKEDEISVKKAEKNIVGKHVENRLRSFYQIDDISIINTLFSASNLPELLNLKQYFQAMFHYDQEILQSYSTKISLLSKARNEIVTEKETLLEIILETKTQEELLLAARQKRADLLTRVQTEENLYRHALEEIKQAAKKLSKRLSSMQVKVIRSKKHKVANFKSNKKRKPFQTDGFSSMQGKLTPPAIGKVTIYFGTYVDKFNTQITSSGINIETTPKIKAKSIYSGIVVFAGEMESYGNMVIIDHGQQYHSLTSGLDSILIKKGDQVTTGQPLGIMDDGATLLSKGLHFEIRYNSQPVDPFLWLDISTLTVTEDQYQFQ